MKEIHVSVEAIESLGVGLHAPVRAASQSAGHAFDAMNRAASHCGPGAVEASVVHFARTMNDAVVGLGYAFSTDIAALKRVTQAYRQLEDLTAQSFNP